MVKARHAGVVVVAALFGVLGVARPDGRDYRQDMRDFVQAISAYAKAVDPDFIVIPQNGQELLTLNGESDGTPAAAYIGAIDGQGQEDLFYGYTADNVSTPGVDREYLLSFTHLAEAQGLEALVTDYCWTQAFVDDSYAQSASRGFISFAANHRGLDNIPPYPALPYGVNPGKVTALAAARNFLYLLDPGPFATRTAYLNALRATNYDAIILDLFYDDTALSPAEIEGIRAKANGGSRLAIAYMSIGEAENYRYYWQPGWEPGNPAWLAAENPDWAGNYKVQYWDEEWQALILGSATAYLDRILAAGFDGVYLDIVDAFEYFEEQGDNGGGCYGRVPGAGASRGGLLLAALTVLVVLSGDRTLRAGPT
ncbi:MAG: hypothetical protein GWP08_20150 [Nitrospiraceae bacterium]|nr:hypothetical protein [Nitrospiraceae bacterium]